MDISKLNYLWLDSPFFNEIFERLDLSQEDRQMILSYKEDGYLIIDTHLENDTIDKIIQNKNIAYKGAEHETKRALDNWQTNADIKKIANFPYINNILKTLYQREAIPFQTINFNVGSEKMAHSDAIHFNSFPEGFMCGVWIALEDINENNGPIEIYPGSQKLPYFTMIDIGKYAGKATTTYEFYEDYEKHIDKIVKHFDLKPKQIHLKKGQALIWSSNMLHSGAKILDKNLTRYSQVNHYYFENCMYYGPLFSDIALGKIHYWEIINIKTGEKVKHKYFGEDIETHPSKMQKIYNVITEKTRANFLY